MCVTPNPPIRVYIGKCAKVTPKEKKMREREIEEYLRLGVKRLGGAAFKFKSLGNAGVPDRIVIVPGGDVYFVELKAEEKRDNLSPLQKNFIQKLENLNCKVRVIASFQEVDEFIEEVMLK